jgi:L-fuconolactonase
MISIRRDFLPEHLQQEMAETGITGTVAVQARQSLQETSWLLDLASQHRFIHAVTGWAPLTDPSLTDILARLASYPKLRSIRHVLQDEPDDFYMLRDDFNRGIRVLKSLGLAYDILIFERHLPQTIQFVDLHPDQIFILDHLAKPRIKTGEISYWRKNILELAKRQNVYCKLSGLVTEADYNSWTEDQLRPYIDIALEAFTPRRLMFGSDWPVCLVATTYRRWFTIVDHVTNKLSTSEQERFWYGTAMEAYGLTNR